MANAARGASARLGPVRTIASVRPASWLPKRSNEAALRAVRATVVAAGLFALTDRVIGNLQMATFAAFGAFATLVLASFSGTRRDKLLAHIALALTGSALLTIGTAINSKALLGAIVTLPVVFAVFFAGITGPNAASGATASLLAYVLPAASPGTISMVGDRLAGWWLASVAGTISVLVLSPPPAGGQVRAAAARLAQLLADQLRAALGGDHPQDHIDACIAAKHELIAQFTATPYRPTGLAAPEQAFANSVELLEWCTSLIADATRERADLGDADPCDRELLECASYTLADVARLFGGRAVRPDLERLMRSREQSLQRLDAGLPIGSDSRQAAQLAFHAHAIAVAVLATAIDALVASRVADPGDLETRRRAWFLGSAEGSAASQRVSSVAAAARRQASLRSVWFINSARGAVAIALAVAIADLSSVQHGFWVVLGTLSVLRTNAASTGSTALRALAGTAVGFVVGGALLLAIGSDSDALWIVLPIAIFAAAYTPGTAPFAVGQAAFTVTVAVLFNLLVPVGWQVGVVRIEDVAIGCGVSILVGAVFWPRGVSAVVGDNLADAYRAGAAYLVQAIDWACGRRAAKPDGAPAAVATASRLDDALRGFIAEQGAKRIDKQELWRLVGGSMRLRLTAHAVTEIPRDESAAWPAQAALEHRANTLAAWYERLANCVGRPRERAVAALQPPVFGAADTVDGSGSSYTVWLCEHLDHLAEHLGELVQPAADVAQMRRRPWWR